MLFAAITSARTRAAVMERRIRSLLMAKASSAAEEELHAVTHLPFIVAAYVIALGMPIILASRCGVPGAAGQAAGCMRSTRGANRGEA